MWKSAAANAPTPSCMTMNPIWPDVDQTRPPFTSVRTSITAVANSAVMTPTAKASAMALTDEANTGENRMSKTPAPLIDAGVQQRGHGRRCGKRGRQPCMQRHQRRPGDAGDHERQRDESEHAEGADRFGVECRRLRSDVAEIEVTDRRDGNDETEQQHQVADEETPCGESLRPHRSGPRGLVTEQCDEGDAGRRPGERRVPIRWPPRPPTRWSSRAPRRGRGSVSHVGRRAANVRRTTGRSAPRGS